MRVLIFGGTFDPPHFGHLRAAEIAREVLQAQQVWFVVTYIPPHKNPGKVSPAPVRLTMTELAVESNPYFLAADYEIKEKICYTIDSLAFLRENYRDREFVVLMGEDSFAELPTWKEYMRLLEEAEIAVIARKGMERGIPDWFLETGKPYHVVGENQRCGKREGICFIEASTLNISSTHIRQLVHQRRSIRYLVPEKVERYIIKEGLYR